MPVSDIHTSVTVFFSSLIKFKIIFLLSHHKWKNVFFTPTVRERVAHRHINKYWHWNSKETKLHNQRQLQHIRCDNIEHFYVSFLFS